MSRMPRAGTKQRWVERDGRLMSLLGIGDNQEQWLSGADYEMMQLVADDIQYQIDQQDFIQNSRVSFTPAARDTARLRSNIAYHLRDYPCQYNYRLIGIEQQFSSGTTFKVGEESYDIIIRDKTPEEEEEDQRRQRTVDDLRRYRS